MSLIPRNWLDTGPKMSRICPPGLGRSSTLERGAWLSVQLRHPVEERFTSRATALNHVHTASANTYGVHLPGPLWTPRVMHWVWQTRSLHRQHTDWIKPHKWAQRGTWVQGEHPLLLSWAGARPVPAGEQPGCWSVKGSGLPHQIWAPGKSLDSIHLEDKQLPRPGATGLKYALVGRTQGPIPWTEAWADEARTRDLRCSSQGPGKGWSSAIMLWSRKIMP